MPKKTVKSSKTTLNVNFRLSQELMAQLEVYGKTLTDDAGLPLGASLAARRIVVAAIRKGLMTKPKA